MADIEMIAGLPKDTQFTRDTHYQGTGYADLCDELAARVLCSRGYRQVSNRFRQIARCSLSDQELAHFLLIELRIELSDQKIQSQRWHDYYRRCYSKDLIIEVPEMVMKYMRQLWENVLLAT